MMSNNSENSNSGGRPTKYKEEFVDKVYKLALLGATDKEMADIFDIVESTFNEWKLKYPKFSESLKKGKIEADANVSERLYKRALGYQYKEITKQYEGNGENRKLIKDSVTTKTLAPDPTAQIFWLKNRRKNEWRDSKNIDHTTKGKEFTQTRDERDTEIKELIKKHNESE